MASEFCNHPLVIEIAPELPLVAVDGVLIAQVLENLVDNACKYSPYLSPITISARLSRNLVEIGVHDCGIGIPTTDLERIFDKFYRVQHQETIAGTGLGLSICKGIIEAHGGLIWAANNPDQGATLFFTLPLSTPGQV
jgi:two-component system sensor histidine kinase KdpD